VTVVVALPGLLATRPGPTPSGATPASDRPTATATAPPTPAPALRLPDEAYGSEDLVRAVASGRLDGRLVLVRGSLESIAFPCDGEPDPLHTCVMLAIEGLDLDVMAGVISLPWHDDPPPGDSLVVVPDGGRLVYLGHVAPDLQWPSTIDGLTRALLRNDPAGAPPELFLVDGWLVMDPPSGCPGSPAPSARPCYEPGPFLADEPPVRGSLPANSRGSSVLIGDGVGIDPTAEVVEGSFLVAMLTAEQCATAMFQDVCGGTGPRWVVEAVYDDTAAWSHVP
jgi:hypothetical protein